MRVRKSFTADTKQANKKASTEKGKKAKAIKPNNKQTAQQPTQQTTSPTNQI